MNAEELPMCTVLLHYDVDLNKVKFGKHENISDTQRFCPLALRLGSGMEGVHIQTPCLSGTMVSKGGERFMELRPTGPYEEQYDFFNKLYELDCFCVHTTSKKSKEWFHQDIEEDVVRDNYRECVRSENEAPVILLPVGEETMFYNAENELMTEAPTEEFNCETIIHLNGIQFMQDVAFLDITLEQVRLQDSPVVRAPESVLRQPAFI